MGRFRTELDIEAPNISMLKTLELDFTHQPGQPYGGLNTDLFKLDAFNWLWLARMKASATTDAGQGRYALELQGEHRGTRIVEVTPAESGTQRIINRESQYYVRRFEQAQSVNNLQPLVYHDTDNALTFRTMPTPDEFSDKSLGNLSTYEVISFDPATNSVRLKGQRYDRKEPSTDGVYAIGQYTGLEKFLRDILDSDTEKHDLGWKFKSYPYAHAKLPSGRRVTYDRLIDDRAIDPLDNLGQSTGHTMFFRETIITDERPRPGQRIQLYRRQPFVSGMLTTAHTFSQKYWMVETEVELSNSFWQFFAIFGWNMYQETTDGVTWEQNDLRKRLKSGEIDIFENPCGDIRWRFFNAHAPLGGQYNMASVQNRQPVMPELTPEWDRDTNQEHQLEASVGVPLTTRATLRHYWYGPNNGAGKPANSQEWYMQIPDGRFMRIGGCLCPDFWANGELDDKQFFFNGGAHGDFSRGLNYIYGGGKSTSPDVRDFVNKIYRFEVSQFLGQEAGGAGAPGPDGKYPEGKQPTPGDMSGNSGSGTVQSTTGGGPAIPGGNTTTPFNSAIDVIAQSAKLVVPEVGKKYPVSARLIRNTEGYGVRFDWETLTVAGFSATVVDTVDDGSEAEITFTAVPGSIPEQGVALDNFLKVTVTETSGAGTAPVIKGGATALDSGTAVPDDTDTGIGSVDEDVTLTVTSTGPNIAGASTGIDEGEQVRIVTSGSNIFYATIQSDGSFTFDDFGTDYDNQQMNVIFGSESSNSFNYENEPAASTNVEVLRYEVLSVTPDSVTLYIGLSENKPARILFGTTANNLDQNRVISATEDFGYDVNNPHIYKIDGLTTGTTYHFKVEDHVGASYETSVITGTPQ